jgi:ribosomal protein S18 acetylase RimI-like enzyme
MEIRPATPADEHALGQLGASLMRSHHATDPRRFIQVASPEAGYGRFLITQLADAESCIRVAERDGEVVGYVYACIEGMDWMNLRGPAGVIHDVAVLESARRTGVGRALIAAALEWIGAQGRTQVVLHTMTQNAAAQALFAGFGFRPTMIEMTRDGGVGQA